ncbi:Gnk2-homologous domain [Sesbania bispinosa]|nr:Gnk2-homologous domain [Sesbania bispinosa]
MLRYSNNSFNNLVPSTDSMAVERVSDSESYLARFNEFLAATLNDVAQEALNSPSDKKFATKEANFTSSMTLYTLVQCTPDLSTFECNTCFRSAIGDLPACCDGKRSARSLLPGCNVRYELYPFYNVSIQPQFPSPSSGIKRKSSISVIVVVVVPIVVAMVLFILGLCFLRKRASDKYNTFNQDSSNLSFNFIAIASVNLS